MKLQSEQERISYLVFDFAKPIQEKLYAENFEFTISGRPKSIYSIWNKMQTKNVTFDEIYDLLAIGLFLNQKMVFQKKDKVLISCR